MGDCIECGAPNTAVHESALPSGLVCRVRKCEACLARVETWRADVVRRRGERHRELLAAAAIERPAARVQARPSTTREASRAAALDALASLGV